MKKIFLISFFISFLPFLVNAQEVNNKSKQPLQKQAMWEYGTGADQKIRSGNFEVASADNEEDKIMSRDELREKRREKYKTKSGQQQGMKGHPHQEIFENLTEEQKKLVKTEMDRHRAAMKQITGFDVVLQMPKESDRPIKNEEDKLGMPQEASDSANKNEGKLPEKESINIEQVQPKEKSEEKSDNSELQKSKPERKKPLRSHVRRQFGAESDRDLNDDIKQDQ